MKDRSSEHAIVRAVAVLEGENPEDVVRPDRINRTGPDVDGLVGRIAIEHTRIQLLPNMQRATAQMEHVLGPLFRELRGGLGTHIEVRVPFDSLDRSKHAGFADCLREGILEAAPRILPGQELQSEINGVLVSLRRPLRSSIDGITLGQHHDLDETEALRAVVAEAIHGQEAKFAAYSEFDHVVVLEDDDMLHMNSAMVFGAIAEIELPTWLSRIWCVDSVSLDRLWCHLWIPGSTRVDSDWSRVAVVKCEDLAIEEIERG